MMPTIWHGAYNDQWGDLLVPEAFGHPAKIARGVAHRLYRHLLDQRYVKPGDHCLDPFGGICGTGLDALTYGLRYTAVELEAKFVALGQQNLDLWRRRFGFTGGRIVQGDSRFLRRVLTEADCCIGSPPFGSSLESKDRSFNALARPGRTIQHADYGATPGQLGALKPGTLADALVASPPYAGNEKSDYLLSADGKTRRRDEQSQHRQGYGCFRGSETYGHTEGQLGAMPTGDCVISSPPYAGSIHDGNGIDLAKLTGNPAGRHSQATAEGYGSTPGNLGNLPVGEVAACVSNPPFCDNGMGDSRFGGGLKDKHLVQQSKQGGGGLTDYGEAPGQLSNTRGNTFWSAASQIMAEVTALLTPGGVACWIVKGYISKGTLVDFPAQWRQLCEAHGFVLVEEIHASLVEEHGTQETLFGLAESVTTERKSFFRRLAEKKGSPRIDHETILILKLGPTP